MDAYSLTHGLREWDALDRQERELFEHEPLTDPDRLRELIDNGTYLAIECTGFARSIHFPGAVPEGIGRTADGLLPFDRALIAGREQLNQTERPFRFALDIAVAHYYWRMDEPTHRATDIASKLPTGVLDERLNETLRLYLHKVFKDDQYGTPFSQAMQTRTLWAMKQPSGYQQLEDRQGGKLAQFQ